MTIYDLKPRFQALLRPGVGRLYAAGISANQVTLAALGLSCLMGAWLALWPGPVGLLLLPVVLLLRMALNAIDGMLAREFAGPTPLGSLLNELGDCLADVAIYLPLGAMVGQAPTLALLFVGAAAMGEFIGVWAMTIGASRRYDGPMGKSDRAFWCGAFALAAGLYPHLLAATPYFLLVLLALQLRTCWRRAALALAEVALAGSEKAQRAPPAAQALP
jgi:phosphatidylglycerophosphate synthase